MKKTNIQHRKCITETALLHIAPHTELAQLQWPEQCEGKAMVLAQPAHMARKGKVAPQRLLPAILLPRRQIVRLMAPHTGSG